jgi:hypothetical protein
MIEERPKPDFFYEVSRRQLDVQLEFLDAVDDKLGLLFSIGSAEVGIIAAFLLLRPEVIHGRWLLLLIGALSYFALALASILGLWDRSWQVGPDAVYLGRLYNDGHSDDEVKRHASRILAEQWYMNRGAFNGKRWRLRIALLAVVAQTICALVAVLLEAV